LKISDNYLQWIGEFLRGKSKDGMILMNRIWMVFFIFGSSCLAMWTSPVQAGSEFDRAVAAFNTARQVVISDVPLDNSRFAGHCVQSFNPNRILPGLLCLKQQSDPVLGKGVAVRKVWDEDYPDKFIETDLNRYSPHPCERWPFATSAFLRPNSEGKLFGSSMELRQQSTSATPAVTWIVRQYHNYPGYKPYSSVCWLWKRKF
jgi:hypothetical protein